MIVMAIKGRSAEQKAALAEIVASETLLDIEEYIRPQFAAKRASSESELLSIENELTNLTLDAGRRIVQDGHGRWREVKPRLFSNNLQSLSSTNRVELTSSQKQHTTRNKQRLVSSCSNNFKTQGNCFNYNDLSMALRSNVFPGLGNNEWNSTTAEVFMEQQVIPSSQRNKFFGIQTDEFGQWSAANVHHERMKKKWDAYLDALPKQAGSYEILYFEK